MTGLARGLPSPMELLGMARQKLDEMAERLPRSLKSLTQDFRLGLERITARISLGLLAQNLKLKQSRFQGFSRLLDTLSYQSVLARGFAVLYDKGGRPVASALGIGSGEEMAVELTDGRVPVVTTGGEGPVKKPLRKSVRKHKTDPKQGSLL